MTVDSVVLSFRSSASRFAAIAELSSGRPQADGSHRTRCALPRAGCRGARAMPRLLQFADPVGRQRAFVELAQFDHVAGARADQHFVDAGPEARAVAHGARLRARRETVATAVVVESRAPERACARMNATISACATEQCWGSTRSPRPQRGDRRHRKSPRRTGRRSARELRRASRIARPTRASSSA